jgi:hypothetical protein
MMVGQGIAARTRMPVRQAMWVSLGLVLCAAAHAQSMSDGLHMTPLTPARWSSDATKPERFSSAAISSGAGQFASIEMSGLPGQRPRHSLRFRFNLATEALRDWGMPASDCAALVRSSHHRSSAAGSTDAQRALKVSLALNCRFF